MMSKSQSFIVERWESGQTLAAFLKRRLDSSWTETRRRIQAGRVQIEGQTCRDDTRRVRTGQRISLLERTTPNYIERKNAKIASKRGSKNRSSAAPSRPRIGVVHVDEDIVVVEKPPGLTTVRHRHEAAEFGARAQRFLPRTLADWLPQILGPRASVRAVHRLDRDTSGLLVFARTPDAEVELGRQFRAHQVRRRYLAIVRGCPTVSRVESLIVPDRGDGRRGSSVDGRTGQRAVTAIRVLERLGDFSLVECRLETGRTHQVRIHLGELGTPICGERIYDRPLHGPPLPDSSGSPRIALHAASLGLAHPRTGEWLEWHSPLPDDLQALVQQLRSRVAPNSVPDTSTEQQDQE